MAMKDPSEPRTRILQNEAYETWLPPHMGQAPGSDSEPLEAMPDEPDSTADSSEAESPAAPGMTAAELDALREQAHSEGYEQGHKEGFEFGHNEGLEEGRSKLLQRLQQLDQITAALSQPFEELDQQVEQEIVTLVVAMVRQLVRREVKTDPAQIIGVVREALGVLPVSARRIRVLLHPEDAVLVRDAYALGESDQKWQIIEDPVIARGGCRVYTENSQIDATLESRLNSLIAPLLASERGGDASTTEAAQKPIETRQDANESA